MRRGYIINRYKGYSIRQHHFVPQPNGGLLFETDDPEVQALIENADGYGAFIFPRETAEEIAQMKSVEGETKAPLLDEPQVPYPEGAQSVEEHPIAVQGARGTGSSKSQRKGQVITGAKRG